MMLRRAYPYLSGAQQRADRLVRTEAEFRHALGEALSSGTIATIRLAADIILSRTVRLAAGDYACVVDGGGRYAIRASSVLLGENTSELFQVEGDVSGLRFRDLEFVGGNVTFGGGIYVHVPRAFCVEGYTLSRILIERVGLRGITDVFGYDTSKPTVTDSDFKSILWYESPLPGPSLGTAIYHRCLFERLFCEPLQPFILSSVVRVYDDATSTLNVFVNAQQDSGLGAAIIGSGDISALPSGPSALSSLTLDEGLRVTPSSVVTLSGANPSLDLDANPQRVVSYTLDATTSGNATVAAPSDTTLDKLVVLRCVNNLGAAVWKDSVSLRLASDFNPTTSDTLTIVWDGGVWLEVARSVN